MHQPDALSRAHSTSDLLCEHLNSFIHHRISFESLCQFVTTSQFNMPLGESFLGLTRSLHRLSVALPSARLDLCTLHSLYAYLFSELFLSLDHHRTALRRTLRWPALRPLIEDAIANRVTSVDQSDRSAGGSGGRLRANLCILMIITLECCCQHSLPLDTTTRAAVLRFIRGILRQHRGDNCHSSEEEAMETLLYSVLSLEKVLELGDSTTAEEDEDEEEDIDGHIYEEIHEELSGLLAELKRPATRTVLHPKMNTHRQQVAFCTEWLLSHYLIDSASSLFHRTPVKLSPDGLTARCDSAKPYTIRSEFIITSGVYFYEVVLLTCGSLRIGWANKDSKALEENGTLGDDGDSIGFNGNSRCICHGADSVTLSEIPRWKVGDIVGCLIDVDRSKFVFYLNGLPIYYRIDSFNTHHVFASATLTQYQQIYFNFGQNAFRYPPHSIEYDDFHSEANGNHRIYRILEPTVVYIRKDFVHFADEIQDELDLVITRWLTKRTSCLILPDLLRNQEFIKYEQGILRLSQSMINLRNDDSVQVKEDLYYYYDKLYFVYFIESNVSKINILAKFLKMITPIITAELSAFNWIIHRNLCLIMLILMEHCKYAMKQEISEAILEYLLKVIEHCDRMETVLYALVGVELRIINIIQFDLKPPLRRRIMDLLTLLATDTRPDLIPGDGSYRYQVAFCARWTLEHIFVNSNLLTSFPLKLPPVKLSPDRLSVRCESSLQYMFVRSSFAFLSGVYFYEVTLLTGGLIRIGWASKASKLEEYKKLGDDRQSIGFNGYDRWIWHGRPVSLRNIPRWQPGDTIGCLIDTEVQLLVFYLNGHPIQLDQVDFAQFTPPYFAAAFLFPHQQCYFNFGQDSFRYPPKVMQYEHFHGQTAGESRRYQLTYLSTKDELWHLFELEEQQKIYDEWLLELESRVRENYYDEEYFNVTLLEKFATLMDIDHGRLRLYHSIIRLLILKPDAKVDILVGWIEHYSTPKINLWSSTELVKLINSFIEVPLMGDTFNDAKRRNICIVLFLMARTALVYLEQSSIHPEDFFLETYHFLSQTLLQLYSFDPWTLLFAVNCLQIYARYEANRVHLLADEALSRRLLELSQVYENTSILQLYEAQCDCLLYQIGFCAHLCLGSLTGDAPTQQNSADSVKFYTLTSGRFTARGDWQRQNFRSAFSFVSGVYYYEAILLTSGSMKIGWATTELEQEKFAICLDLYQRYLWHGGRQVLVEKLPSWKVGDVLGCLINVDKAKFVFYLNGAKIDLKIKFTKTATHFYSKPYFAAVSLASHQQCAFNFGQVPFKYAPKGVHFGTFTTAVKLLWTC